MIARGLGSRVLLLVEETLQGSQQLGLVTHSLERASVPTLVVARGARQNRAEALNEAVNVARGSRVEVLATLGGADQLSLGRSVGVELGLSRPIPYLEVPSDLCCPLLLRPEAFLSTGRPADLRFVSCPPPPEHHLFVDPHTAVNLGVGPTVGALLGALFYALDGYLAPGASLTQRSLLAGALEVLWSAVRNLPETPGPAEGRWEACQAGFNVAVGCSLGPRSVGLTLAHILAGVSDLPTPTFASVFLAPFLEEFAPRAGAPFVALARSWGLRDVPEATLGPRLAQEVRKLLHTHRLPLRLADFALVDSQLDLALDVVRGLDLPQGGALDGEGLGAFVALVR